MCFDEVPEAEIVRCFDISLILYAEQSFKRFDLYGADARFDPVWTSTAW